MAFHPLPQTEGKTSRVVTDGFGGGEQEPPIPASQMYPPHGPEGPSLSKSQLTAPPSLPAGVYETSQLLGPRKPPAPAVPVNQAQPCTHQAPNICSKCNHLGRPSRTVGLEA